MSSSEKAGVCAGCRLLRPRFVSDFPPGQPRERLTPVLDVRALLPYAAVTTETVTWEILNADRKVVSRLYVETHSVREPDVTDAAARISLAPCLMIAPLRGYPAASESLAGFLSAHFQSDEAPDLVAAFLSVVDRRRKLRRELAEKLPGEMPELVSAGIPYSSAVEKMGLHRKPMVGYASGEPAARAYESLWEEIGKRLSADEQGSKR